MGDSVLLWEWNYITGAWVQKPACVETTRLIGTGLVRAGACYLHWIKCNPSVAASVWEVTDAVAGGGIIVFEGYHASRESHNTNFIPPRYFTTGIYLETFTNMTSLTFGIVQY